MIINSRRVGQRVIGSKGLGTIIGLGRLRGEPVAYVQWDEFHPQAQTLPWRDTVRVRDIVILSAP